MSDSLYDLSGDAKSPNSGKPENMHEREEIWKKALTQTVYEEFREWAARAAYRVVRHWDVAYEVADDAIAEVCKRKHPPLKSEIKSHLWRIAQSRAKDRLRKKSFQGWLKWIPLMWTDEDGVEREAVSEHMLADSAEKEFFDQQLEEESDEVDRRRLAQLHRAVQNLAEGPRRDCFELHFIQGMKIAEVAEELLIDPEEVRSHLNLARKQVANFMRKQEKEYEIKRNKESERRSSQ